MNDCEAMQHDAQGSVLRRCYLIYGHAGAHFDYWQERRWVEIEPERAKVATK